MGLINVTSHNCLNLKNNSILFILLKRDVLYPLFMLKAPASESWGVFYYLKILYFMDMNSETVLIQKNFTPF